MNEIPSPQAGGWTPVDERLPEAQSPVLLDIGGKYPIRAMWVEAKTLPAGDADDDDFGEYDEANDEWYCPAGWYEWNQYENRHWSVSAKPLRWMELPRPGAAAAAPGVQLAASRRGRVYLAGPMTGYAEFNFPAFHAAAAALRADGIEVVNPAEHGIVDGAEWADYLRADIAQIAICESIALLPGWSKSRGATLEVHVARALGMPIIYLAGSERPAAETARSPCSYCTGGGAIYDALGKYHGQCTECTA